MHYYTRVYCYRILIPQHESSIILAVEALGGHVEYRRDVIDLYIPESVQLTLFLLRWSPSLMPLDWLDFHKVN
jgi:hypothetical protein